MTVREDATRKILQEGIRAIEADPAYKAALERQAQLIQGADEVRAELLTLKDKKAQLDSLRSDAPVDMLTEIEQRRGVLMAQLVVLGEKIDAATVATRQAKQAVDNRTRQAIAKSEKRAWLTAVQTMRQLLAELDQTAAYANANHGSSVSTDASGLEQALRMVLEHHGETVRVYPMAFANLEED